jgi:hypothetical protein
LDTIEDTFNGMSRTEVFYVVADDKGDNLLTVNVFNELIEFDKGFKAVTDDGKNYNDWCYRIDDDDSCEKTDHPLEFVEIEPEVYSMAGINTDAQLL